MVYASLGEMDLKMIHLFNSFDLCMFFFLLILVMVMVSYGILVSSVFKIILRVLLWILQSKDFLLFLFHLL